MIRMNISRKQRSSAKDLSPLTFQEMVMKGNKNTNPNMASLDEKASSCIPEFVRQQDLFDALVKKEENYPQISNKRSSLTKSLSSKGLVNMANNTTRKPQKSPKRRTSFSCPTAKNISPSLSSGSLSSVSGSPLMLPRSITPIASPVNPQDLALCAELDIDQFTLDSHGALKRGIDLKGIALCEKYGIHLDELKKYNAVRRNIDITGISMCKANGVEIDILHQMNAIEPNIDISGIAICESVGIDIYVLQDYGFIEPQRSLRTIAMLKEQGYMMEEIFMMNPGFDCL